MGTTTTLFRFENRPASYRQGRGEEANKKAREFNGAMREFLGEGNVLPKEKTRRVAELYLDICRRTFCGKISDLVGDNPRIKAAKTILEYYERYMNNTSVSRRDPDTI